MIRNSYRLRGGATQCSRERRRTAWRWLIKCFSSALLQDNAADLVTLFAAELHPELRGRMDAAGILSLSLHIDRHDRLETSPAAF